MKILLILLVLPVCAVAQNKDPLSISFNENTEYLSYNELYLLSYYIFTNTKLKFDSVLTENNFKIEESKSAVSILLNIIEYVQDDSNDVILFTNTKERISLHMQVASFDTYSEILIQGINDGLELIDFSTSKFPDGDISLYCHRYTKKGSEKIWSFCTSGSGDGFTIRQSEKF